MKLTTLLVSLLAIISLNSCIVVDAQPIRYTYYDAPMYWKSYEYPLWPSYQHPCQEHNSHSHGKSHKKHHDHH